MSRRLIPSLLRCILAVGLTARLAAPVVLAQSPVDPDAPRLRFDRITLNDGLPDMAIVGVVQDSEGFVWIATTGGLTRYDGYVFHTYSHDPLDPGSLSGSDIKSVHEDRNGRLWVGTYNDGLNRFDRATETFTRYRHDPNDPTSLSDDRIHRAGVILEDSEGVLWVGTVNGLNRYDPDTDTFVRYHHDPADPTSLASDFITQLYELPSEPGTLLIGTDRGLDRYDRTADRFARFDLGADGEDVPERNVGALLEDRSGILWMATWDGLYALDRKKGTVKHYGVRPNDPRALSGTPRAFIEDGDGVLWIGTSGAGLHRFDRRRERFTVYRHDPYDPHSIGEGSQSYSASLYEDREGTIWISAWLGDGISLLRSGQSNVVASFSPKSLSSESLGSGIVAALHVDTSGTIWAGTTGSVLVKMDENGNELASYRARPGDASTLGPGWVSFVYASPREPGILWIGTESGLNRMDTTTGRVRRFDLGNMKHAVAEDRYGNLWIASRAGLFRFERSSGRFESFSAEPDNPAGLSNPVVWDVFVDADGIVWAATDRGLNRLDPGTGVFTRYLHDSADSTSLSGNEVRSIFQDRKGRFWVGTTAGLNAFDPGTGVFRAYTRHNSGLPNNKVKGIIEDAEGRLWFNHVGGTGVTRFDPESERFEHFGAAQGVTMGGGFSSFAGPDGQLYFGGSNGFVRLAPEKLKADSVAPKVALTGVRIFDQLLGPRSDGAGALPVWEQGEIRLSHDENDLTFSYVGLHFRNPSENTYRYRMEGYESDWIDAGTQRTARYANLPPGRYVFRVEAANPDGVWSADGPEVAIRILPPWWRTTLAYLMYGLLFLVGVAGVDRFQRRRLIRRERERARERELEQAREIERAYTQLKATQAQLVQQEKMASLGQLTAGIAHEIQNPLNFVNNFAEMSGELAEELRTELLGARDRRVQDVEEDLSDLVISLKTNAAQIAKHGRRADAIVKSMMELAGAGSDQRYEVGFNAFLSEYVDIAYNGLRARNPSLRVHVDRELDSSIGNVTMAPRQIGRALVNVLNNAFEAAHERAAKEGTGFEPTVTIRSRAVADDVEIRISDNGGGIPEAVRQRIFEPFFTTKPTGSGIGLGLSLAWDIIVDGHGGRIVVESPEGEGTTFAITLPAASANH